MAIYEFNRIFYKKNTMSIDFTLDNERVSKQPDFMITNEDDDGFFYDEDDGGLLTEQHNKVVSNVNSDLDNDRQIPSSLLGSGEEKDLSVTTTIITTPEIRLQQFDELTESTTKRKSHLYSSVDDITRDSPIRRAACTSCALCDANAVANGVKRNKEGGFQLRKAASCSICTWDIEEFEFEDSICNPEEEEEEEDSDLSAGESINEEEEDCLSDSVDDTSDGPTFSNETSPPGRNRSNSYTRAMDDEEAHFDLLRQVEHNNLSLSQRLPPDGGEIVDEQVEENHHPEKESKKIVRSSSPKTRLGFVNRSFSNHSNKKKGLKSQSSMEKKISQELDEIFGKLHRSPQQSFEEQDTFDDPDDSTNSSISHQRNSSKRGSFRKAFKTPSFLKRKKANKLDVSKSKSVEFLYVSEPVTDHYNMKKSVSTMDVSSYYQDLEEGESEQLELNVNEAFIEYLDNIGGTVLFSG